MAKLSRIQKYADLRSGISTTIKEDTPVKEQTQTIDTHATHYEDKLKKLESFFNSEAKEDIQSSNDYIPPEPKKKINDELEYKQKESDNNKKNIDDMLNLIIGSFDSAKEQVEEMPVIINKTKTENIINEKEENNVELKKDDDFIKTDNNVESKLEVEPKQEITIENKPEQDDNVISEKPKQVDNQLNSVENSAVEENNKKETINVQVEKQVEIEDKKEVKPESFVKPNNAAVNILDIEKEANQLGKIIDTVNNEYGKPQIVHYKPSEETKEEKTVEDKSADDSNSQTIENVGKTYEAIKDFTNEVASSLKSVIDEINNIKASDDNDVATITNDKTDEDFITNTLVEVNNFNKNEGNTTLEELPGALIDEIRHNIDEEIKNKKIDDEFNNTVTIEINKVLDEIKDQNNDVENIAKPTIVENKTPELDAQLAFENAETKVDTFVNDNSNTNEEPVVEIKNITETMNHSLVNSDVLDDTIPFVVNKDENEEEVEEDDEDKASPVLNIILGVLIVVLLAVLAVFVYYILVARGIIE